MKCTKSKNAIATFNGPKIYGSIRFHQCNNSSDTLIKFNLFGFENNKKHAIHIHEYGDTRKGCESLGSHWNPCNTTHGSLHYNMPTHAGDLINNLQSDNTGKFNFKYYDNRVKLFGIQNIYGRSIVIHDGIDDLGLGDNFEFLKTGNAGGRIACAIIGISSEF